MSFKIFSILSNSAAVVSIPQNAVQSLATTPAPIKSDPQLIVAAPIGTSMIFASSVNSSIVQQGWTNPPWLLNLEYVPTKAFPDMVVLKTSTPSTS